MHYFRIFLRIVICSEYFFIHRNALSLPASFCQFWGLGIAKGIAGVTADRCQPPSVLG